MATEIAISAGGADAVSGSNVGLAFDGSTNIVITAHTSTTPTAENLITAANCTWEVLDVPKGTTFDAAWFNTNTASWPNVNTFPTVSNFVPDKEGTWFFRCTNSDGTVDEVVVGVRHQRTHIRVPAAGETTEANSTRGWAENRNDDLDTFDDLITSGGIQLCRFVSASAGAAGTLVQFNGATHDINPTSGAEEFVPDVEPAANNNPGIGRYLGVIKAKKDGSTTSIASGSLVWVSRSGMVEGSTAGILDLSAFSVGDSIYVGSNAGLPASSTDVDTATATLAGFVVRAENPGAMVVSPAHINNVLTTKSNSTDRDQQFVEVEIFEAPISGHNLFNISTDSSSARFGFVPYGGSANAPLDFPGARLQNKANVTDEENFLFNIALDERCIREGVGGGSDSNFMEYPLVLEVHAYCQDQNVGTAFPTLTGRVGFEYDGVANANATEATLVGISPVFNSVDAIGPDFGFGGSSSNKRQIIFRSSLILNTVDNTTAGQQQYYGAVSNDLDNLPAVFETAYDTPPVAFNGALGRSDSGAYDIIVTKVVLKALYPVKSRAKRLSFYEKQIPAAALVDTSQTFNGSNDGVLTYAASTVTGLHAANVLLSDGTGDDANDFSEASVSANLRGETAGVFCGFFPFDTRARKLVRNSTFGTDLRDLRFRAVCKFKRSSGTSGTIKLKLHTRSETKGKEFSSLSLTTGYDQVLEVTKTGSFVAATEADEYRTIVFDFPLSAANYSPNLSGIRFRLERVANSGETYKTVDNLADASTTEQAFCVSTVCLSEANLDITKDQANIFEEHLLLDRQIDYNDGALNLANWANTGSDVVGFKFTKGGSETLVVPINLDERYDEQSDLTVEIVGTVGGTTSSGTTSAGSTPGGQVSLQLQSAMSYVDDVVPGSFSTVSIVNVDTSTALTGSNLYRTIRHEFTVPFSQIAQASGIVDDNLSIPKENVRGNLYLKITRTDTTGPNTYLASSLDAYASVDKLPNADPYVDISEDSNYQILVPGGFRHDPQRDLLTSAYRHNWQFGVPLEFGFDLKEAAIGGLSTLTANNYTALMPSNFIGNTPLSTMGMATTFGPLTFVGQEVIGKHIPFSMVITAIHGFMGEIGTTRNVDGLENKIVNYGLDDDDAYIELNIVDMHNTGSAGVQQTGHYGDDHPGIVGFPFRIYPDATSNDGRAGIFRVTGSDLSNNESRYYGKTLPRVYLPADYKTSRQYMLAAYLFNNRTSARDFTTTVNSTIPVGSTTVQLADVSGLPEEGRITLSDGTASAEFFNYSSRYTSANTVTGASATTIEHGGGDPVRSEARREIISPIVDLNIEVAFLPNTTGNDLIY